MIVLNGFFFKRICGIIGSGSGNLIKQNPYAVNVFDFNVQHHYQLYRRRESLRLGGSGLRSLARPLLTLMQADHRLIMSPVFAQSLLHQMTRLPHVYLYQICREPEMRDGEGERRTRAIASLTLSLCTRHRLGANYLLLWQESPPPLSTALPSSPALQLLQHLPLNMQSACQGIKETYIHTNVAAGVKLIFTDIRSVRTYSPLIWSWRNRPEHCQLIPNSTRTAILNLMSKPSYPLSSYGCTILFTI